MPFLVAVTAPGPPAGRRDNASPSDIGRCDRLDEGRPPGYEVRVERLLDLVANPLGKLQNERAVVRALGAVGRRFDRLQELDPPLRRKWHDPERAEQRE